MTNLGLGRAATMIMLASVAPTFAATCWASDLTATAAVGAATDRGAAIARRVPWTSSTFAGTPDPPPPYAVEPAFPHLKFEFPVVLVRAKGTRRLFLGDLRGRIYSFPDDPGCQKADLGSRSISPRSIPI